MKAKRKEKIKVLSEEDYNNYVNNLSKYEKVNIPDEKDFKKD